MKTIYFMVVRNRKLFFRDKGMFISSLITPIILIVLYATFLANVYKDSFASALPDTLSIPEKLINGTVASQLAAALLAVSCVTVTFCVNLTMVQDVASGARKDFNVSPIKRPVIFAGYFIATVLNSLLVNYFAMALCLVYIALMGWYLTVLDIILVILDIFLLVLFGSVLSSLVCYPLKTQGQMSAVGTIVSAGYGFICGAYMPVSNFGEGLQKALSFFPGTYGTSLIKNHLLKGAFTEMEAQGFPKEIVTMIGDSLDCHPEFCGKTISTFGMYLIMLGTIVVLGLIYLLLTSGAEKN